MVTFRACFLLTGAHRWCNG